MGLTDYFHHCNNILISLSSLSLSSSEYCGRGCLKDLTLPLDNTPQLNKILYQTALALEQMHQLNITHRDLKIENILFDNSGYVKLCDFGSATTNCYQPDHGWTPIQRSLLEDEVIIKLKMLFH